MNYINTENITQEIFYCKVSGFLNNPDNFPAGAYEEPYWVSRRFSEHYKATQEEMDAPLPNKHLAIFAHPGNSEGWILSVYLAPEFDQLVAAKYFCKESCLEAVKQLTKSLYQYQ